MNDRLTTRGRSWAGQLVVRLLLVPLRLYKAVLSPLLPPVCRFHPSCSVYAMGAISVHGPFKGLFLAARRVSRCHPFHAGGLDPVPPRAGVDAVTLVRELDPALATRLEAPIPPAVLALMAQTAAPVPADAHQGP